MDSCWFCYDASGVDEFSWEFDCYLHRKCLREALACEDDVEAQIMGDEFGLGGMSDAERDAWVEGIGWND